MGFEHMFRTRLGVGARALNPLSSATLLLRQRPLVRLSECTLNMIFIYIYIYIYTHICTYMYRERERDRCNEYTLNMRCRPLV